MKDIVLLAVPVYLLKQDLIRSLPQPQGAGRENYTHRIPVSVTERSKSEDTV